MVTRLPALPVVLTRHLSRVLAVGLPANRAKVILVPLSIPMVPIVVVGVTQAVLIFNSSRALAGVVRVVRVKVSLLSIVAPLQVPFILR